MSDRYQKIAVLGDLHFETEYVPQYHAAREQILAMRPQTVFQLGDQGGYTHCGSWLSFMEGLDFLSGFKLPFHTLIGNHDMEGAEYASDADSIAAWCRAFQQPLPYYTVDLGETLAICLSSTRCRSSPACHQEVYLEPEQIAWFENTLERNRHRPTFVFSHAPILGSGVRVLQSVHLKCPNAWINHTDRPEQFIQLAERHPQIKLWFSAHNHLGQAYPDSVSQVGNCTYVHTGVIGHVSRDGCRQSRFVEFNSKGLRLSTVDHVLGQTTLDLSHEYFSGRVERVGPSNLTDGREHFAPPACPESPDRLEAGRSVFTVHRGMLLEYDRALSAPLGVVLEGLQDERIHFDHDGLCIVDCDGRSRQFRPDRHGRYLQVFTPNPWPARPLSA